MLHPLYVPSWLPLSRADVSLSLLRRRVARVEREFVRSASRDASPLLRRQRFLVLINHQLVDLGLPAACLAPGPFETTLLSLSLDGEMVSLTLPKQLHVLLSQSQPRPAAVA